MRTIVGLAALCTLLGAPGASASPTSGAARAKKTAFERLAKRDYGGGIAALEEAHRQEPQPENLYNIAVAYEKWGGHCADALETYRRYLETCPECARVNTAKEKLILLGSLCGRAGGEVSERRALPPQHAEGWAEVRGQDVAGARKAAIADGLRQAVEMVAGVEIAARWEDTTRSRLDGDRERFTQEVHSAVRTRSEGFVRRYDVLADAREDRLLKVHLLVEIDEARVRSEVEQIADRIARARYPRLVLYVEERYRGQDGAETQARHLDALLRRTLTQKGFEILAGAATREAAVGAGADYYLEAKATTRHTGFNRRGANEHYAEAQLALSLIDLGSGAVVADESRSGNAPGSVFSEARLPELAVQHVAGDLVEVVVQRLLDNWAQAEKAGVRYRLELGGMRRYEIEGRVFLAAVKQVLGVSTVSERAQQGDRLVLEVRYPAGVDVSTLREGVLRNLSGKPGFAKVTSEAQGRNLYFRLGR